MNATRAEALKRFAPVAQTAKAAGIPMRGYVSCVTDCPYDGQVAPSEVAQAVAAMRDLGCYEVSLGDTIGKGHPTQIDAMLQAVCQELPPERLAGHFHDTAGRALANIEVALVHGLRVFDTAVGGLGGCPFAPGAAGNVATEAVMRHLAALGHDTRLDLGLVEAAASMAREMRNV